MTSPPREVEIECPACGHGYQDWWRPSVNATIDPELAADRVYLEEASTATCPNCGHKVSLPLAIWERGDA